MAAKDRLKRKKQQGRQPVPRAAPGETIARYTETLLARRHLGLWLAAGYLAVAATLSFLFHQMPDFGSESDFFYEYLPLAKAFLDGQVVIGAFRGPIYPMVLGIIGRITGDFILAGILISVVSAAIVVFLVFGLIRRLFGAKWALPVALLLALNPNFFMFSYQIGTDMLFVMLLTLSLYLLIQIERKRPALIFSGIAGGIAYLTRYNGIVVLVGALLILVVNFWKAGWAKRLILTIVFTASFFATITPWGLYCLKEKGNFFYNEYYQGVGYELYGQGVGKGVDPMSNPSRNQFDAANPMSSAKDVLLRDPLSLGAKILKNAFTYAWNNAIYLTGWPIGLLALAGVVLLFFTPANRHRLAFYLFNLAFFGVLLMIHYEIRYPLFLIPCYLILAVRALFLADLAVPWRHLAKISVALLLGLMAWTGVQSYRENSARIGSGPEEVRIIANWFKENVPAAKRKKIVAARKPHIAYYMGVDFVTIPVAGDEREMIEKLKAQHVDYLYFGGAEVATRRNLINLVDPSVPHEGLKMMAYTADPASVLYRLE